MCDFKAHPIGISSETGLPEGDLRTSNWATFELTIGTVQYNFRASLVSKIYDFRAVGKVRNISGGLVLFYALIYGRFIPNSLS